MLVEVKGKQEESTDESGNVCVFKEAYIVVRETNMNSNIKVWIKERRVDERRLIYGLSIKQPTPVLQMKIPELGCRQGEHL